MTASAPAAPAPVEEPVQQVRFSLLFLSSGHKLPVRGDVESVHNAILAADEAEAQAAAEGRPATSEWLAFELPGGKPARFRSGDIVGIVPTDLG